MSYPDDSTLDPRARRVLEQAPVRLNLFSMLANAPSVVGPILRLGAAILSRTALPATLRELAILRVAARTGTAYEWHHHEPIGRRSGLDPSAIEAAGRIEPGISSGDEMPSDAPGLVLRLVDETLTEGAASARVISALEARLEPAAVVELVCTVGYYTMIGQIVRSLDVEVDAEPVDPTGSPVDDP